MLVAPDGSNARQRVHDVLHALGRHLLRASAHDTKSINMLIGTHKLLLYSKGTTSVCPIRNIVGLHHCELSFYSHGTHNRRACPR